MTKIINHDEFIHRYQLSRSEYCLLPKEMRLTYLDMIHRWKVNKAKEKGVVGGRGYMQEAYAEYFEACGCEVVNYDFGIEEYEIKSVRSVDFTPTEENKKAVSDYVKFVAELRWSILKTTVENILYNELARLSKGEEIDLDYGINGLNYILTDDTFSSDLDKETKKEIVEKEIDYCVKINEELEMNSEIDTAYIEALKDRGYSLDKSGNTLYARILK